MKAGWITATLDDACLIEYGTRVVQKKDGGSIYPVYGGGGATFYMDSFNRSNRLIVSRFGMSEQCTRFISGEFFLNDSGLTISPKSNFPLSQVYLDKHLLYLNDQIFDLGKGSAQKNLDVPAFRQLKIRFPENTNEQHRIVTLLDEAFADIATAKFNAEKNLQNARTLFISHLQSSFSQQSEECTAARIADIAKHSLGKMLDKVKNRGDLKPYLRNLNVRWFEFDLSDVQEMKFTPEESNKYTAIKGDVLICEGGYPGRCAIWEDDEPIHFQKALHRVRFHNPLHSKWFVNYLYLMDQTGDLKNYFSGTGIQHFTGEALAKFTLPVPPDKQIQQALATANQLEVEVVRLESIYRQKLTALDDLKKSLLHQAFSGQL